MSCPPDRRRTILVRLSQIPLDVRLAAYRQLAPGETPEDRAVLFTAALRPRADHDEHWVTSEAAPIMAAWTTGR